VRRKTKNNLEAQSSKRHAEKTRLVGCEPRATSGTVDHFQRGYRVTFPGGGARGSRTTWAAFMDWARCSVSKSRQPQTRTQRP